MNTFLGVQTSTLNIYDLFKDRAFDRKIIRCYLRFKPGFRDLLAERGISLAHNTIMRWITRNVPEFEKRWNRFRLMLPRFRFVKSATVHGGTR